MSATPNTTKSPDSTDEEAKTRKETAEQLSDDKIFHLLQVKRRRDALRYLQNHNGSAKMRDVTEQVAAWENDTTIAELSSNERQRVYISLYQSHLPKLDKEGVVNYDQSRGNVTLTPLAEQLKPYLDVAVNDTGETADNSGTANIESVSWLKAYQYLTVVGFTIFLGIWANISLFTAVGLQLWAGVIVTLFGVLSSAQILLTKR